VFTPGPDNLNFLPPPGGLGPIRERLRASPKAASRPLLVLGGWRTPRLGALGLASKLRQLTGFDKSKIHAFGFFWNGSLESAIDEFLEDVAVDIPEAVGESPTTVDVVGLSMGGIVARLASIPRFAGNRTPIKIARLFTMGSPHRGAVAARVIAPDRAARQLKPGSKILRDMDHDQAHLPYPIYCYARLNDWVVGAENTAPIGLYPFWVPGPPLISHHTIGMDDLILLDIALRLRGEEPIASKTSRPPRN
jgi:hypothetical protein